jgi:hypothetical protein
MVAYTIMKVKRTTVKIVIRLFKMKIQTAVLSTM